MNTFELPQHMIDMYLSRREKDLEILESSLLRNAVDDFNRIGHQIAGNATNFGFEELEIIGRKMESLTHKEFAQQAVILLAEFREWLKKYKNK